MGGSIANPTIRLEAEKPCYICIIGGPGSGKTTQSRYIHELFDFAHLSTGQILRQSIQNKKLQNWENIQNRMNEGKLVDSDIVLKLLIDEMDKQKEKHIILDGFPINEENFEAWDKNINRKNILFYLYNFLFIISDFNSAFNSFFVFIPSKIIIFPLFLR